jgi:hypothetical protein
MTTSEVVGGVFFARDQLFRMEELPVCPCSNLVNDRGFQIYEHSSWHVLPSSCLAEKSVERIVSNTHRRITEEKIKPNQNPRPFQKSATKEEEKPLKR